MVSGRRPIQRRPNRSRRRRNAGIRNKAKLYFTGRRRIPRAGPRSAQDAPWNPLVVQRTLNIADNATFSMSISYIRDILANQLGVAADGTVTFRLLAIDLYDLASRPFELAAYDYMTGGTVVPNTNAQISTVVSWPDRDKYSRASFEWPKAISATPFRITASSAPNIVLTGGVAAPLGITSAATTSMLLRAHVLWRLTQTSTEPSFKESGIEGIRILDNSCSSKIMQSLMNPDNVDPNGMISQMERVGIHMDSSL